MTQKELEKLSRKRLLEMLVQQTGKADRLERENDRLKERIADREQHLDQMSRLVDVILNHGGRMNQEHSQQAAAVLEQIMEKPEEPADDDSGEDDPPEKQMDIPDRDQLLMELRRESSKRRYVWSLKTTVYALVMVAAVAVLVAVLFLPVLQIYGSSMNPTLFEGDFVVSVKNGTMDTGDLVAFYYNNKVLVKRVIGQAGQWVDIAEDGTVYVDNVEIKEPYLYEKAFGECDLDLPYQVPEGRVFVMGDNRAVSVDSRSTAIGCVAEEQLVGKIVFCVWPLNAFGKIT